MFRSPIRSMAIIVCAAVASVSASAVNVSFSITGDSDTLDMSDGLTADVSLDSNSDTVDLTPNVETDVFLQSGSADVFQGDDSTGDGSFDLTLSITSPTASPASRAISQDIFVTTYQAGVFDSGSADVQLGGTSPVQFDLGSFTLTVTPTGVSRIGQSSTDIAYSNNASFLLTPAPEPTCAALAIVGAGALLTRRRRAT
jgi:MYXO-CTERM domain-containing protein